MIQSLLLILAGMLVGAGVLVLVHRLARPHEDNPVVDALGALWRFWAPRLTDKAFVSMGVVNVAMLLGYALTPEMLNWWVVAIQAIANLFFPIWETQPFSTLKDKPADAAG